jgi:MGT family glycosyltransferase
LTDGLRAELIERKIEIIQYFQNQTNFCKTPSHSHIVSAPPFDKLPPTTQSFRFLFVLIEGGGTVPGLLGLAHQLIQRGHFVCAISDPCNEVEVKAAGCHFIPYHHAPHRHDKSPATTNFEDHKAETPAQAIELASDTFVCKPALAYAKDVLAAIEKYPVDVVVVSELVLGGCLAAEKAKLPFAMIWWAMYTLPYSSSPSRGSIGWFSDQFAQFMFQHLDTYGLPTLQAARQELGLPPIENLLTYFKSLERILVMSSLIFDHEVQPLANVRYIGPTIDVPGWKREAQPLPWPSDHPDPLVVIAFSATMLEQYEIVQRVIDALDGWAVRGLVILGSNLAGKKFDFPENVISQTGVWRKKIFPKASAVVTHAGHMTVMQSLAYGVPLICIPMGREQYGNATRVASYGVGMRLSPTAKVSIIRQAIQRVVHEPSFHIKAAKMGKKIVADARSAAGVLELENLVRRHKQE